jgi:ribonuclease-3
MKAVRDLDALQARLGHRFRDIALLDQALTHVSSIAAGAPRTASYQRLEFLGDRVLGLAIAEMLSAAFPGAEEGELSLRSSELVRKETCAEVAGGWNLGPNIRLGGGEAQSGARKRLSILGDACEAVIGAVFLDGGYAAARAVVEAAWRDRMLQPSADRRSPKAELQEFTQARGLGLPVYREVARSGPPHRMTFSILVEAPPLGSAEGLGSSKREAEQAAAAALLAQVSGRIAAASLSEAL